MTTGTQRRPQFDVLRTLAGLLRPWWPRLLLALLAGVLAAAFSVALSGTAAWLIATAAGRVPVLTLLVAIVVVRACGIGRGVLRYVERLLSHDAVLALFGTLRERAVFGLAGRLRAGRLRPSDADALARVTRDVDDLQDVVIRGVLPWISSLVVGVGVSVVALLILPTAGVALLAAVLLGIVIVPALSAGRVAAAERDEVIARAGRDALVLEMLDGMNDLVATDRLSSAVTELSGRDDGLTLLVRQRVRRQGRSIALAVLLSGVAAVVAAVSGVTAVHSGSLDPVLLAVVVLVPFAMTDVLIGAAECVAATARSAAAAGRVLELIDSAAAADADSAALVSGASESFGTTVQSGPARPAATIRLEDVSIRWPGSGVDALHGVDLELRAGERIAVTGPSGSGKSTLVALLLGLLPARSGRILVDGVEVDHLDGAVWVPAQTHLFDSTIAANVRLGVPDATDETVQNACLRAGLGPLLARDDGLQQRVGVNGGRLSGGEGQRIAVARALAVNAAMIVADEPAAHLDGPTADAVTAALLDADPAQTVVMVTHRPADLDLVDRVLTVEAGTVTEQAMVRSRR